MANARIFDIKRGVISTTDGGTATLDIAIPSNTVAGFSAIIVLKVISTNAGGMIPVSGSIANNAGTATLQGTNIAPTPALGAAITLATAVFTASGTSLRLTATGVAAIGVIDWQYEIKIIIN